MALTAHKTPNGPSASASRIRNGSSVFRRTNTPAFDSAHAPTPTLPRKRGRESEVKPRAGGGLSLDNGDGAGPAGRGAADLDREATHHKPVGRERFEIVQLFEVAITDLAPGLVTFPDQVGIAGRGIFLLGVDKGRIPAPAIGAGQPDAAFEEVQGRVAPNAAAGRDVIRFAVGQAGARIHDDDLERLQRVPDAIELGGDILGGDDIAVREMPEIEFDAGLQAP